MLSHSIDVFFINYKNTISQRATWLIGSKATLHLTLYHSITCASYFISLDLNGLNMFKLFKSTGFHIHDYREEQLYPEILLFRFPSDFYSAIGARHTSLLALFDVSSASNSADLCILFQDLSTSFVPTDKPLEWLRSFLLECIDCVTFDSPRLARVHALLVSPRALFLDFFCTLSTRQIGALLVCLTDYMRMTCRYTLTVMWLQYTVTFVPGYGCPAWLQTAFSTLLKLNLYGQVVIGDWPVLTGAWWLKLSVTMGIIFDQ